MFGHDTLTPSPRSFLEAGRASYHYARSAAFYPLLLLGVLLATSSQAQVTPFGSLTTFQNATTAIADGTMPDNGGVGVQTQTVGSLTFDGGPSPTLDFRSTWTSRIPGNQLAIVGNENFDINLAVAVRSLGFEFVEIENDPNLNGTFVDSTFTVSLFNNGNFVDSIVYTRPNDSLEFIGFTAATPFDSVRIRETVGSAGNEFFGQFFTTVNAWNAGSGAWDSPSNWTQGAAPTSNDPVLIAPASDVTVAGPAAAATVDSLTIDNRGGQTTRFNLQASSPTAIPFSVTGDVTIGLRGNAVLTVPNEGVLNVGGMTDINTGGRLQLAEAASFSPTGPVSLNGGTLSVDTLSQLSGNPTFNWNSGTLEVTGAGGFSVPFNGPLGPNPILLDTGKALRVTNKLTVASPTIVTVDGGTIEAGDMETDLGTLNLASGTVNVAGTYTNRGTTNITGGQITATNYDDRFVSNGLFTGGTIAVDGGTFTPFAGLSDFTLDGPNNPTLEFINGGTTNIAGDLSIAEANQATLLISSGSSVTNARGLIGTNNVAGSGNVTVDGFGSTWTNDAALTIGQGNITTTSDDQLTVDNGGAVIVNGNTTIGASGRVNLQGGTITVNDGDWSRNISSEFEHTGGALIVNNGNFESGATFHVLNGNDRPGITLQNGATHTSTDVQVNNGDWRVESGSRVTGNTLQVFNSTTDAASQVIVNGPGSRWDLAGVGSNELVIGSNGGDGSLVIVDGAVVDSYDLQVGTDSGSTGQLEVAGAGARLQLGDDTNSISRIGGFSEGTGVANITNGGQLVAQNDLVLGAGPLSDGTLNVRGDNTRVIVGEADATTNIDDGLTVGDQGNGTLRIGEDAQVVAESLVISRGSIGRGEVVVGHEFDLDGQGNLEVRGITIIGGANDGSLSVTEGGLLETSKGGNYQVVLGDAESADDSSLVVDNATWNHVGNGSIIVAKNASSNLSNINNGPLLAVRNAGTATASGAIVVAEQTASVGEVFVTDAGSSLSGVSGLQLGLGGIGRMTIQEGGTVVTNSTGIVEIGTDSGGVGSATVTGLGSTLTAGDSIAIGNSPATGGTNNTIIDNELFVFDGATASSTTGDIYIARGASPIESKVTVRDTDLTDGTSGSLLSSGDSIYVGGNGTTNGGTGQLTVEPGGKVTAVNELKVWNNGTVNLDGGTIEARTLDIVSTEPNPGQFNFNTGTFRYTGAGTVVLNQQTLGAVLASNSTVENVLRPNQELAVAGEADLVAPLRLAGGTFSVGTTSSADLDNFDWDAGTLNVTAEDVGIGNGGLLGPFVVIDATQAFGVPNNRLTVNGGSSLHVVRGGLSTGNVRNNGTAVFANSGNLDFDADDDGTGLTNNNGAELVLIDTASTGNVVNSGHIEFIGDNAFGGDLQLNADSSLRFDIEGQTDFDSLSVAGDAIIRGILEVGVRDYNLTFGDSFEIIDVAGASTGMFAGLGEGDLVGNFGGVDLFIYYTAGDGNDIALSTVAPGVVPGDFNNDGIVNAVDYTIWRDNLGQSDSVLGGNGTRDPSGLVVSADYLLWKNNYGVTFLEGTSTASVPEPTAVTLLCGLLISLSSLRAWFQRS